MNQYAIQVSNYHVISVGCVGRCYAMIRNHQNYFDN